MPTQSELGQEQGFRSSLFGFDKNDVLAYMNALAVENRQREEQYRDQLQAQQQQVEKMQGEQAAARLCVEKLQSELQQARQLQEAAEQRARQAEEKQAEAERDAAEKDERWKTAQQSLVELRFRCKELEDKQDTAPAAAGTAGSTADARVEARKILADARLYAENAERRMQQQAQEQKERMADHARGIAAGVLLLRSRLSRVDEKISAATLDMENVTSAIYQALDEVDADLDALGARLDKFDPDDPVPSTPPAAPFSAQNVFEPPAAPRQRMTAQAVPQRRARAVRPPVRAGTRLRRTRSVADDLEKAIDRFADE